MMHLFDGDSDAEVERVAADWVIRRNFGLSPSEARELHAWTSADPRHAEALARHARVWAMLDRPRAAGHGERVVHELAARGRRRRRRRIAAVAGVACTLALLLAFLPRERMTDTPGNNIAARSAVLVPEQQILPDGTKVDLRAGSAIAVHFEDQIRRVVMRGGIAHFEVVSNPARPFVVEAASVTVRAVGTAFSVELSESNVEVLVTHGRVAVAGSAVATAPQGNAASSVRRPATAIGEPTERVDDTDANHASEFTAGSRIVVGRGPDNATVEASMLSDADLSQRLAWRSPRVEFADTPLEEAVALMNRHGKTRIRIANPALARTRINGLFRADNTDTFIELLELSVHARATRVGDEIVLDLMGAPAGR